MNRRKVGDDPRCWDDTAHTSRKSLCTVPGGMMNRSHKLDQTTEYAPGDFFIVIGS